MSLPGDGFTILGKHVSKDTITKVILGAAVLAFSVNLVISISGDDEDRDKRREEWLSLCSGAMQQSHTQTSRLWTRGQLEAFDGLRPEGLTSYSDFLTLETGISEMSGVVDGFQWRCRFVPQTSIKTSWVWEDL
jgi:hypothetical protein